MDQASGEAYLVVKAFTTLFALSPMLLFGVRTGPMLLGASSGPSTVSILPDMMSELGLSPCRNVLWMHRDECICCVCWKNKSTSRSTQDVYIAKDTV